MRRVPVVATIIVLLACTTMVWLGVWQLQRARWKESLLGSYAAAEGQPLLTGLPDGAIDDPESVAFRRARLTCSTMDPAVQIGGRNRAGATGYRTIRACRTPGGALLMVDLGWAPPGGAKAVSAEGLKDFTGVLIPDPVLFERVMPAETAAIGKKVPLLLVAETPVTPLQPSVPPSIAEIPNNHRAYAVQWFLFAATALIVYLLALRRRRG
ncbi:SURF1 family protein [Sphingomonas jatrophae]|uniref:SURF1-like protein n=1 Tax=Sphingomonas jatrophae TaxID=1166337 RepID=A0A1I6LEF0_9SPHN|nr:SURF1 family protein [Sphingomonas jatrophae]SFS01826.1 Cytochrome oxidase assembly protein ShyY1 [Sphingomonas jatrophae]